MPAISAPLPTPTHNTGAQAQGALYVAQALDSLKKAIAMLDPSAPLGQAVADALKKLGKEVGSAPPETQVNSIQSQLIEAKRNAMQRLALQQMSQQGAQQPGAAPAAANQNAPQPAAPPMAA